MPISQWCPDRGSVMIYPHCVVEGKILDLDNVIQRLSQEVSSSMPEIKIQTWKVNTFCSEVNGLWNRIITIYINEWKYHYMIRRDITFNSTYGCPFYNSEYPKEAPLYPTFMKNTEDSFSKFEICVFKVLGVGVKKIKEFPT
jgi:hypothetical protein